MRGCYVYVCQNCLAPPPVPAQASAPAPTRSMAIETIDLHGSVIVTRSAKMLRAVRSHYSPVRPLDRMAGYALLEAVLLARHACQLGLVMLALENRHMVSAQELRIVDAAIALSPGNDRHRHTFSAALVSRRVQHAAQAGQNNQYQNQHQCDHRDGAVAHGHGLLSQPHPDIPRWTDICTNVAADALRVVGVDIVAHGRF